MKKSELKDQRKLRSLARKLGCTVKVTREFQWVDCRVTAPEGYWFENEGIHEFVDGCYEGWEPDYKDLYDRLVSSPPVKHEDSDCEWCHEH